MAATWVLKFPQVDKPKQPILVHVTRKQGTTFDLDLLATDGDEAYRTKVRERNLSKLRSKNFEGTDAEWKALLRYTLVSKRGSGASEHHIRSLEVDGVISDRDSKAILSITLRSRIEDITHRLGAIDLSYSDNTDDVDLFGWACLLADQRDGLEIQSEKDKREAVMTKTTIQTLERQLADLVKAKEEHEDQLLTKFSTLLNEKKTRIRDQLRTLEAANLSQEELEKLHLDVGSKGKNAGAVKRKRDLSTRAANAAEDEESDGFEAMDVDKDEDTVDEGDVPSGAQTPSRSDSPETETASEDEGDKVSDKKTGASVSKASKKREPSPLPPPRQLPFQKKGQKSVQTKKSESVGQSAAKDDEETESEDDEL